MRDSNVRALAAIFAAVLAILGLVALPLAAQTVYPEIEPNDNKAQALANGPFVLTSSDSISGYLGSPTGSCGPDYWLVRTVTLPLGIYEYRLQPTPPSSGHAGQIRGRDQSGGVIGFSDVAVQSGGQFGSSTPPIARWYGFGKGEQLFFTIVSSYSCASTSGTYVWTLSTLLVSAADLGIFVAGSITIATTNQPGVNTDLWIYDAGFNAIPGFGNDNAGMASQSSLTRTYVPGAYYLAISLANLANNLASPPDDGFQNGYVLDHPDAVVSSHSNSSTVLYPIISDTGGNTVSFVGSISQVFAISWFKFTVVSPFSFFLSQPSGAAGDLIFTNGGGTAGNPYLNAISLTSGAFPNGWFYGIDIPFNLLVTEYLFGLPFSGVLNVVGGALGSISGPLPPGLQLFSVGVEFSPSFLAIRNSPPFIYTTL